MDLLPRAMAETIGDRIKFNAKIVKVRQQHFGVELTFDCKGVECSTEDVQTQSADLAIFTTPAGPTLSIGQVSHYHSKCFSNWPLGGTIKHF